MSSPRDGAVIESVVVTAQKRVEDVQDVPLADAVAGMHSQPAEMWSEEYQADMIEMYIRTLEKLPSSRAHIRGHSPISVLRRASCASAR